MLPLLRIWCKCFQELFNTDFSVLLGWVLKSRKLTTPGLREKVVGQKEDICDCVEDSYLHLFWVIRSIISNLKRCHEIYKMLNGAQKDASHQESFSFCFCLTKNKFLSAANDVQVFPVSRIFHRDDFETLQLCKFPISWPNWPSATRKKESTWSFFCIYLLVVQSKCVTKIVKKERVLEYSVGHGCTALLLTRGWLCCVTGQDIVPMSLTQTLASVQH